jgi:hypothetical protein
MLLLGWIAFVVLVDVSYWLRSYAPPRRDAWTHLGRCAEVVPLHDSGGGELLWQLSYYLSVAAAYIALTKRSAVRGRRWEKKTPDTHTRCAAILTESAPPFTANALPCLPPGHRSPSSSRASHCQQDGAAISPHANQKQ